MGKDRQEKKLKASRRVESDRDQALHYKGSTKLSGPDEARGLNDGKDDY
ncbi:YpzI family protein [Neobacillus citreus]|uniref:YpzI family protein n=1 Tax=Neobacillus citreus TaxID=2833578 RepID=A0A942T4M8_9BACI|nr:YpzI family protein [Neobacillus citreus]MCH6269045.1 YpzI family protein [Neobacillus citreus]